MSAVAQKPAAAADIVFVNGTIYTACPAHPLVESVAVAGERIVYAGPAAGLSSWRGARTEVINLEGMLLLPGFHDAHLHPLWGGLGLIECRLNGLPTPDAYTAAVAAYIQAHPEKPFIRGGGWVHSFFPETGPRKEALDAVAPDIPVLLKAIDGHSAWGNSKAFELGGITADTPDPPGGHIERDPRTGSPSGTLREWTAMNLVERHFPPPSRKEMADGFRAFQEIAVREGLTAVHDAMVTRPMLDTYAALENERELKLQVTASVSCEPEQAREQAEELPEICQKYTRDLFRTHAAKIFLDGVVEAHTAFLLEPYQDRPDYRGELIWRNETFSRMVTALDRNNIQIHVHAVGDGAARMALDAFETAFAVNGVRDARHQIAHLDVLSPEDIPRFRALGVMANVQPAWFYCDANLFDQLLPYLGESRALHLYRIQSLLNAGARVACSSDWPFGGEIVTFRPLDALRIGVTRLGIQNGFDAVYAPEECASLASLIDAYTLRAAHAHFLEQETGTITTGNYADLVVVDRDLFQLSPMDINKANILLTLFRGGPVYRSASL